MNNEVCREHSGCLARISNLEKDNTKQWGEISRMNEKVDSIMTRLNIVLGSVVVACIMLVLNLLFKVV